MSQQPLLPPQNIQANPSQPANTSNNPAQRSSGQSGAQQGSLPGQQNAQVVGQVVGVQATQAGQQNTGVPPQVYLAGTPPQTNLVGAPPQINLAGPPNQSQGQHVPLAINGAAHQNPGKPSTLQKLIGSQGELHLSHNLHGKRPYIIDDFLGPYSVTDDSQITFSRLKPYVSFIVDNLDEKLEDGLYKAYMIFLLIVSGAHVVPLVFYFMGIGKDLYLAIPVLVVLGHFACAIYQSFLGYEAVRTKERKISKAALRWMKLPYIILSVLLIAMALIVATTDATKGIYYVYSAELAYIVLFIFHLVLTLVGAVKVDKILKKKERLNAHLNNFAALEILPKNDLTRNKTLFDILYRLSEKDTVLPIPNKYRQRKFSHAGEYAEVMEAMSETVKTITELIPH